MCYVGLEEGGDFGLLWCLEARISWELARGKGKAVYQGMEEMMVVVGHGGMVEKGGFVGLTGIFEEEIVGGAVGIGRALGMDQLVTVDLIVVRPEAVKDEPAVYSFNLWTI